MGKREKLSLRYRNASIDLRTEEVRRATVESQERIARSLRDAAERDRLSAQRAEERARLQARSERQRRVASLVRDILKRPSGWPASCPSDGATRKRVEDVALQWTRRNNPEASRPTDAMVAAREAEIIVQRWLIRLLQGDILDISQDTEHTDEEGLAYRRYDLLDVAGGRRFDVKNTIAPTLARHVLGRDKPARGVTLVGVARLPGEFGRRYELLGVLDSRQLDEWKRTLARMKGVGVLETERTTMSGAAIQPSWMFGSIWHQALARPADLLATCPIDQLDDLSAWHEVEPRLRLLSPPARQSLESHGSDIGDLLARLAARIDELCIERLELRHLYVLVLEDFRLHHREQDFDPTIYERALVSSPVSLATRQDWRTPGGTWDPLGYFRTLVDCLKRLCAHGIDRLPELRTLHVTSAGTIIANHRAGGDRGGLPTMTLLTRCGNKQCETRLHDRPDVWLTRGDEGVEFVEPGGFLRCPTCGSSPAANT